jgi:hypothetical protein
MGPKAPRSTVLTAAEEAVAVAFRKHTLLPLDDCLYALQATIPRLTRSTLHRCFQRHSPGATAGASPGFQPSAPRATGGQSGQSDQRRRDAAPRFGHALSPVAARRTVVSLQPQTPATSSKIVMMTESMIPSGTTEVHASRV